MNKVFESILCKINVSEEDYLRNYAGSTKKEFCCDMEYVVFCTAILSGLIACGYKLANLHILVIIFEAVLAILITLCGLYATKVKLVWLGYFYFMTTFSYCSVVSFINACLGMMKFYESALGYVLIYVLIYALVFYYLFMRTRSNIQNNKYGHNDSSQIGKAEGAVLGVSMAILATFVANSTTLDQKQKVCLLCYVLLSIICLAGFPGMLKAYCIKKYYPNKKFF